MSGSQLVSIARLKDSLLMLMEEGDGTWLESFSQVYWIKRYDEDRKLMLQDEAILEAVPACIREYETFHDLDYALSLRFSNWKQKRQFVEKQFEPLMATLKDQTSLPTDGPVSAAIDRLDSERVHFAWVKALARRDSDPEGAITSARSLLESVCKHILDEEGLAYDENWNLPRLYRAVAGALELAPDDGLDNALRQTLGGCQSVVHGLASLRNRLSDAHGKGKEALRPSSRHAELAINLAGTMASFLIATWEARKEPTG